MRIAFVVHDYHRAGGQSRYVAELASRFCGEHEVHVFANRIEPDNTRIHFHTVPAWRSNAFTTVLSFALPVTFQIDRGFDVIHSQGFCGFRGNVFTSHICNRAWHLAMRQFEGRTWRESVFDAVASTLEHGLYRFGHKSAVIAISKRVSRDIVQFYHCATQPQVIYHGVDLELFSPKNRPRWRSETRSRYALADGDMVFLFVGDLRKGARRCIQALSRVKSAHLLFVSRTAPEPYRKLAEETGLADRIHFAGATNQVERWYAAADALLHPTPYDAFGMVVSEAMASGLPVVVSQEAGAAELIQPGVNGLVLEDPGSEIELAQHMQSLCLDRSLAAALGAAARKSIESLSWDVIAEQTMRVYQQLLKQSA